MTQLPSPGGNMGGMTHTSGALQWMAGNASEGIHKEGGVVEYALYARECFDCL